jgi:hypothetical protein
LFGFRLKKILKVVDLNNKIVADTGTWYNAMVLKYIQEHFKTKDLIALDIKLNKEYLSKIWITSIECDLNQGVKIPFKADVIIWTAILEHLASPEVYVKSIYDSLKEWWIFIMTVPSTLAKPILEIGAKVWIFDKIEIADHKKYYKKSSLIKLLTISWFKKQNIRHRYFQCFINNFVYAVKK